MIYKKLFYCFKGQEQRKSASPLEQIVKGPEIPAVNESLDRTVDSRQAEKNICKINVNQDIQSEQRLELKVPKLIVRKVKHFDGNQEIETLEVCSSGAQKVNSKDFRASTDSKLLSDNYIGLTSNNKRKKKSDCNDLSLSDDSDDGQRQGKLLRTIFLSKILVLKEKQEAKTVLSIKFKIRHF